MCIAERMTDFIGVARKEKKAMKWPSKDAGRGGFREGMELEENNS